MGASASTSVPWRVETNERGALHVHGLLWLHGNMHLGLVFADVQNESEMAYQERVIQCVDSVFSEVWVALAFTHLRSRKPR